LGYGALLGYDLTNLPSIVFNYLGQFDRDNKGKQFNLSSQNILWSIVDEASGISVSSKNEDNNIISINGMIINGKLQFIIASKLEEKLTIKLANIFEAKLEDIINYTVNKDRSYITSSDIGNLISQKYLDKLQATREIEGIYLANSLQQGFIYHFLNQGDTPCKYTTSY
jgi:non-ribosomal peptide synthase protein (TIGR01720 family)